MAALTNGFFLGTADKGKGSATYRENLKSHGALTNQWKYNNTTGLTGYDLTHLENN